MDPDIDFEALSVGFDTSVMRRKTFPATQQQASGDAMLGLDVIVFSRTLESANYPAVSVVSADPAESMEDAQGSARQGHLAVRRRRVVPAAARGRTSRHGRASRGAGATRRRRSHASHTRRANQLSLNAHHRYPKSGIMLLKYTVGR